MYVVLSPQLSNLKSNDLAAIDTFISDYNQEIDKYFVEEQKLSETSPKKVIGMQSGLAQAPTLRGG